jgi:hypothetical protein
MNILLQEILAGVLVAGCALFSAWRLASLRLRLRTLAALGKLPAVAGASWLARLRERTLAKLGGGCGSCAQSATRGAASQNQTPGALRR